MNECQFLLNTFSVFIDMAFVFSFVAMMTYIDWFASSINDEPSLYPWNESHLVTMNDSFNVLLFNVTWISSVSILSKSILVSTDQGIINPIPLIETTCLCIVSSSLFPEPMRTRPWISLPGPVTLSSFGRFYSTTCQDLSDLSISGPSLMLMEVYKSIGPAPITGLAEFYWELLLSVGLYQGTPLGLTDVYTKSVKTYYGWSPSRSHPRADWELLRAATGVVVSRTWACQDLCSCFWRLTMVGLLPDHTPEGLVGVSPGYHARVLPVMLCCLQEPKGTRTHLTSLGRLPAWPVFSLLWT